MYISKLVLESSFRKSGFLDFGKALVPKENVLMGRVIISIIWWRQSTDNLS